MLPFPGEKNVIKHLHSSCLSTKLCLMDSKYSIDFIFTDKEKSVCSIKSFSISRLNFCSWVIISGILQHSKAMTIYWCSLTTVAVLPHLPLLDCVLGVWVSLQSGTFLVQQTDFMPLWHEHNITIQMPFSLPGMPAHNRLHSCIHNGPFSSSL